MVRFGSGTAADIRGQMSGSMANVQHSSESCDDVKSTTMTTTTMSTVANDWTGTAPHSIQP